MNLRAHWLAWRRDVVVFASLCLGAVGLGLVFNRAESWVRVGLTTFLPDLLHHVTIDDDAEDGAGRRTATSPWIYRVRVAPGQTVWVRNVVGPVSVEPAVGEFLEVRAVRSFRRSDPASVALVATPNPGGVAICVTSGDSLPCVPGKDVTGTRPHTDVAVQFTLRVPRGVRLDITTVSGAVRVRGASAPVAVRAVNGGIDVETSEGPVTAVTVNGPVRARMRAFGDTGAVSLATVNGAITAELPVHLDAVVDAATLRGRVESAFPLTSSDALVTHRVSGTVGAGGRRVVLHAVNGSIRLLEVRATP